MSKAFTGEHDSPPVSKSVLNALHTKTRGFLKIQDGCNNRCSYCIVPLARGGSRSAMPGEVLHEFKCLVDRGCPEVVLTGVHIGKYGLDLEQSSSLTNILQMLVQSRGWTRIRLSSIEPNEITREMINYLGQGLCRHLHIPLQSGDDAILASMKRNYTSRFYEDLLEHIAKQVPGVALGADIIVGYPGEGDKEFQNTMRLVERSPLTHLHVFSYSPRPGTPAAEMKDQVPEQIKKERSVCLRDLGMKKNLLFRKMHQGSDLDVIVEDKIDRDTGLLTGLTDNYIRVMIYGAKADHIGEKINVRINEVKEQGNFGLIL
jgi:threonylcarbamoyladenosine tRNA methylthiotransferase MtaB